MPYPDQIPDQSYAEIRQRLSNEAGSFVTDTPVGESVYDRMVAATAGPWASQSLRFAGFTARASQSISRVRVTTGSTAAAATPTLCRFGVYSRDSANLYTLVASTVNDIALFAAANTTYTSTFSAPFLKMAGTDYLVATLIVSGVALPTFIGPTGTVTAAYATDFTLLYPQLAGFIAAQADLPATFAGSSVSSSSSNFQALLLQ